MTPAWRFLDTGCGDAAYNMAVDEALLLSHEAGHSPPTLRVYTWSSPTLSFGYAQDVEKEVDAAACREHGVTPVRRPTGGRAVLHDEEATYSVVMPLRLGDREASITEHYRRIGLALEAALRHAGLPVTLERPSVLAAAPRPASPALFCRHIPLRIERHRQETRRQCPKTRAAFPAATRLDSAHHGPATIVRMPAGTRRPSSSRLLDEAYASMAAVNEVAPAALDVAALQRALRQGFADCLTDGAGLVAGGLSADESRVADKLRRSKYGSDAWNLDGPAAWRRLQAQVVGEE